MASSWCCRWQVWPFSYRLPRHCLRSNVPRLWRPWMWCEGNWWRNHKNPFWISGTVLESTRRTTGGIRPPAFGVSMWYSRSLDHLVQGPPWFYPFSSVLCMTNGPSPSRAIPSWLTSWGSVARSVAVLVAGSCPTASGEKSCCISRKRGWQRCRRRWTSFKVPCFATCCSCGCRLSSQTGLWTTRRPWLECPFSISWWPPH